MIMAKFSRCEKRSDESNPPLALEDLLNTLASGDDRRREAAALELGRLGAAAVEPLATMLAHADSLVLSPAKGADVRWWAARALAEIGGKRPPRR